VKVSNGEVSEVGERSIRNSPKRPIGVHIEKNANIEEIEQDQKIRIKEYADRKTTDENAETNDSGDKIDDLKVC
jgi:hypothetical protein